MISCEWWDTTWGKKNISLWPYQFSDVYPNEHTLRCVNWVDLLWWIHYRIKRKDRAARNRVGHRSTFTKRTHGQVHTWMLCTGMSQLLVAPDELLGWPCKRPEINHLPQNPQSGDSLDFYSLCSVLCQVFKHDWGSHFYSFSFGVFKGQLSWKVWFSSKEILIWDMFP